MDHADFQFIARLFERVALLPAAQREAFLDDATTLRPDLRARLASMLRHDAGDDLAEFCARHPQLVGEIRRVGDSWVRDPSARDAFIDAVPRVLGDFEIGRELGRGGMGVVYLAHQRSLDRDVALKLLPGDVQAAPELLARFQREATLLGRISHPHIVPVYLVGSEGRFHYIAMEWIDGPDLALILTRRRGGDIDPLPQPFRDDFLRACVQALRDVADALATAHLRGIVHRDIKPSNILIDRQGRARLADFGLARDLGAATLTLSGAIMGTTYYMSPERFRPGRPSPAADVYALGAVLYECLVGRRPFEGDSIERLMASIVQDDPVPPRRIAAQVPRDLETVILRCLEKDPAHRFADGSGLRDDLDLYLQGRALHSAPVTGVTRAFRRARRRKTSLLAAIAVALIALVLLAWATLERSRRGQTDHTAVRAQLDGLLSLDRLDAARALMDDWLAAHPQDRAIRFDRADLALRQRDWSAAAQQLEPLARTGDAGAAAGLQFVRYALGQTAAPAVDTAADATSARAHYYRSLTLQALGRFEDARRENQAALALDADLIEAWYSLGALHDRLGDTSGATDAFLHYRRLRPGRVELFLKLGQLELRQQDFEAARTQFEQFVDLVPDHAPAFANLAAAYIGLARQFGDKQLFDDSDAWLAKAETALGRAKAIDPTFYLVAFDEAELAALRSRYGEAEACFARALELGARLPYWREDPRQAADLHLRFAHILNLAHDAALADKALGHAAEAQRLWPAIERQEQFAFVRARALYLSGRYDEALQHVDEALAGELAGSTALRELKRRIESKR